MECMDNSNSNNSSNLTLITFNIIGHSHVNCNNNNDNNIITFYDGYTMTAQYNDTHVLFVFR